MLIKFYQEKKKYETVRDRVYRIKQINQYIFVNDLQVKIPLFIF